MAKANGAKAKSMTKGQIYDAIAQEAEVAKADVKKFFAALESVVTAQLGKKGPGVITIPGLMKLTAVKKPARKAQSKRMATTRPASLRRRRPTSKDSKKS